VSSLSAIVGQSVERDVEITGVTADSRKVKPGFLFAALPGSKADGRTFIPKALELGATDEGPAGQGFNFRFAVVIQVTQILHSGRMQVSHCGEQGLFQIRIVLLDLGEHIAKRTANRPRLLRTPAWHHRRG